MTKVEADSKQYYWDSEEFHKEIVRKHILLINRIKTKELVQLSEKFYNLYMELGLDSSAESVMEELEIMIAASP